MSPAHEHRHTSTEKGERDGEKTKPGAGSSGAVRCHNIKALFPNLNIYNVTEK